MLSLQLPAETGTEAQIQVSDIEEVSGEFAALGAAAALLGDQIGDEAVQELRDFGDGVTELQLADYCIYKHCSIDN